MKIKLTRPLIIFDLETTGLDFIEDRIVQLALFKFFPDGRKPKKVMRYINPGFPIPPKGTEIHGVTDEMVKDAPKFQEIAAGLHDYLKGCDIGGFNSNRFDIPFLLHEFERAGIKDALTGVEFIDVFNLYCKFNPRTLENAYAEYCGKKLDAHKADADALATFEVMEAIISHHGHQIEEENPEGATVDVLAQISKRFKNIDILGVIIENEEKVPVFAIGKYKNKPVKDYPEYCKWMIEKGDFTENTKEVVRKILNKKNGKGKQVNRQVKRG